MREVDCHTFRLTVSRITHAHTLLSHTLFPHALLAHALALTDAYTQNDSGR